MSITLDEVAKLVGGEVVGDGSVVLTGVAGIKDAGPGQLTFLSNPKYEQYLAETHASAVVVGSEYRDAASSNGRPVLVAENAYGTIARVMALFEQDARDVEPGVHPSAVVDATAELGADVAVGANAVILSGVVLGDRTVVHPGVYMGRSASVGDDSVIHANVTVRAECVIGSRVIVHSGTVIGSDGFGFAREDDTCRKVPQVGNVVVEDDVEIGANVCIDRATIGTTRIGRGTKIDNLVQIAHNVVIGEDSLIVAQVGISGSTEVGKNVVLAGQAGLVGHIQIGDGAMVGAQAGVIGSIPAGERVSGYPARKHSISKRINACLTHLPSLFARVKEIEKRLRDLGGED
jgi:UDP-3-O-[3-hydroxymyristoyl] glucosamine N-acyltransferase